MSSNKGDWQNDWNEFQRTDEIAPPVALTKSLFATVRADLHPNPWTVFSKLSLIHAFTGIFTLSVCPQFGIRLFGEGMGLMHWFMKLGDYGCMLACGTFYLGTSLFAAALVLRPEEIQTVRKNRFLELTGLTLLSLGFFLMVSSEIVVGLAAAWALGSIFGGMTLLETGWLFRKKAWV